MKILVGNAFPMTLIRNHKVAVEEIAVDELKRLAAECGVVSFWGHENTRSAAESVLGVSLATEVTRPSLRLNSDSCLEFGGVCYRKCYVLSPEYRHAYRPAIGEEVAACDITAWHALRIVWE